jgi:hypothetical protein
MDASEKPWSRGNGWVERTVEPKKQGQSSPERRIKARSSGVFKQMPITSADSLA